MPENNLTEELLKSYKPKLAIMVYEANRNEYYLESHSINEKGQILEGKPLLQETIQNIVDVFYEDNKNKQIVTGLMPSGVLYFKPNSRGNYKMIWYRPEEIRVLHFQKQLGLPVSKCWVPAMIYMVERKCLHVFALTNDDYPTEQTKLFRAPFPNVSDNGSVCLGNAKVNRHENTYAAIMQYWEDLFWLSEFTHFNGSDKIIKKPVEKFWQTLLNSKTKKKWSDYDVLIETKQNLKDLL